MSHNEKAAEDIFPQRIESISKERMYKALKAILITDERGQGIRFQEAMDEAADICNVVEGI